MSKNSEYARVIVHQFDPSVEVSGGIDTCIRGICKYKSKDMTILILGVDSSSGENSKRKLGQLEHYELDGNSFDFIPVAKLNAGNQKRLIPHSLRLIIGVFLHARTFLQQPVIQVHRTDSLLAISYLTKSKLIQFIHTQKEGLASAKSDSVWRNFKSVYNWIDRIAVSRADQVVVFNQQFALELSKRVERVYFSPTWHDFSNLGSNNYIGGDSYLISWIGRLEEPKDPMLAIEIMKALVHVNPSTPWRLQFLGEGTMKRKLLDYSHALGLSHIVQFLGHQTKQNLQVELLRSRVMLITSHKGYEGFSRAILESLSQGVPVIATEGSDTGKLISDGINGFNVNRNATLISDRLRNFPNFNFEVVKESVAKYSAESVVKSLLSLPL
jgi:glycosyltransferase involved in cell wall biosynthesis